MELRGWEKWQKRGEGDEFEIIFDLMKPPMLVPKIKKGHFHLFSVPVINLFTDDSEQVMLTHRTEKLRVRPASRKKRAL